MALSASALIILNRYLTRLKYHHRSYILRRVYDLWFNYFKVACTCKVVCFRRQFSYRKMSRIQRASFLLFGICFLLVFWTWAIYIPDEKIKCVTPECWRKYNELRASMINEGQIFVSPLTGVKGVMLGGVQRSGVNLLRTMLNAHPQLDCSQEISLAKWEDQNVTDKTVLLDIANAVSKQILPAIRNNQFLCIKADFEYMQVLSKVFPSVKVIVVIRDGRAVAHSMTAHDRMIENFDAALNYWSKSLHTMLDHCYMLGSEKCMIMIYEKLVVDTEVWMKATLNFAGFPWHPYVLNHSRILGDNYYKK